MNATTTDGGGGSGSSAAAMLDEQKEEEDSTHPLVVVLTQVRPTSLTRQHPHATAGSGLAQGLCAGAGEFGGV